MSSCFERGQATVEAAVLLPALFLTLGLLLQPSILLFNRCLMNNAAAETCRVAATATSTENTLEDYLLRRLEGIPKIDIFHVGGKSWNVSISRESGHGDAKVEIENEVEPLPLFGVTAGLFSQINGEGNIVQRVSIQESCVPEWARGSGAPSEWIENWK